MATIYDQLEREAKRKTELARLHLKTMSAQPEGSAAFAAATANFDADLEAAKVFSRAAKKVRASGKLSKISHV